MSLLDEVRAAAERVAERARFVRIAPEPLDRLAAELGVAAAAPAQLDPAHHRLASESETIAYIVTLDAINFGSGWFPVLRKRAGCSGYLTIATALKERFERDGELTAAELARIELQEVAATFDQDASHPEVRELLEHFARALRELGSLLLERHGGSFAALVASADGSAEQLVHRLSEMSYYRDVSRYDGFEVPLYKRAQLTASDLATAFDGKGPGRFDDLARLTLFADNLVPHVLRCAGALVYESSLAKRIDSHRRLEAGSQEEVEIRAVAVHAVERMVDRLRERGQNGVSAQRLDSLLWNRGQSKAIKARPRHRARSVYY